MDSAIIVACPTLIEPLLSDETIGTYDIKHFLALHQMSDISLCCLPPLTVKSGAAAAGGETTDSRRWLRAPLTELSASRHRDKSFKPLYCIVADKFVQTFVVQSLYCIEASRQVRSNLCTVSRQTSLKKNKFLWI